MKTLALVMPYYRNPSMLARQFRTWALEWPADLKERVEAVIVDDGSPEQAVNVARLYHGDLPQLRIFRIPDDKPWNQHAARNIGAHEATAPYLLMTDMDHVVPAATLAAVLAWCDFEPIGQALTFDRVDAPAGSWHSAQWPTFSATLNDLGEKKPHVNSFAISKTDFWHVGGYDEDYCGTYGTDSLFRKRLWGMVNRLELGVPLIRVSRDVIADASTSSLPRREGREPNSKRKIANFKARVGRANTIVTLSNKWERVL